MYELNGKSLDLFLQTHSRDLVLLLLGIIRDCFLPVSIFLQKQDWVPFSSKHFFWAKIMFNFLQMVKYLAETSIVVRRVPRVL